MAKRPTKIIGSADSICRIKTLKLEQLKELTAGGEYTSADELLKPNGDPYYLNELIEEILSEAGDVKITNLLLTMELFGQQYGYYPRMFSVYLVKCNHGTTFTEKCSAWPTDRAMLEDVMSSAFAFKRLASKMDTPSSTNVDTSSDSNYRNVRRHCRFTLNLTKVARRIKNPAGEDFYPNASDDQYRIVILQHGFGTANEKYFIGGFWSLSYEEIAKKPLKGI